MSTIPEETHVIRRRRPLVIATAATCAVLLAACGSQVPPKQFVDAQGALVGGQVAGASTSAGNGTNSGTDGTGAGTGQTGTGGTKVGSGGGGAGSGGTSAGSGGANVGSGGGNVGSGGGNVGSGGGAGTSGGNSGGHSSTGRGGPVAGVKAGSCAGFKNTTGITDTQITLANVADISGPVPGLFKSVQNASAAYAAYFNSTSSICGRKLKILPLDSGTKESADQQADTTACSSAFAQVGSMGAFDAGGAATAANCGIPDLRTASTETARYKSPVSFGVYSLAIPEVPTVPFETYFKKQGNAYKNAAFVYLNAGASTLNANSFIAAETKMGFNFKDKIAIDVTSVPNYGSIVTKLKGDGIQYVQYIGAYQYAVQLKSAMYQQQFNPMFVMDPTGYDANYVGAGKPVEGTYSFVPGPLFEEAGSNPGLTNYLTWLQRTSGGEPTFFGVYAWAAMDLFTQLAIQLGGKLTRASLLNAVKGVHGYTDNKMIPAQDVGGKHTGHCASLVQLVNGKWVRKTPAPYTCAGTVNSGVGG